MAITLGDIAKKGGPNRGPHMSEKEMDRYINKGKKKVKRGKK